MGKIMIPADKEYKNALKEMKKYHKECFSRGGERKVSYDSFTYRNFLHYRNIVLEKRKGQIRNIKELNNDNR